MKPGDYVGLYIEDKLIYTGVLKDIGKMESGRTIYQVLLVKTSFNATILKSTLTLISDLQPLSNCRLKSNVSRSNS